jgi:hypothetical protein
LADFRLSDWLDIDALKAQSRRVSAILGVLMSFAAVGFVARKLVPRERYVDYGKEHCCWGCLSFSL